MRTFVICILAVVFFFSAMPVMAQGDDDFVERIQECANRSGSFKDLIIQGDQAVVVLKVMDLYYETWNVKDSSFDQAGVSVSCVDLNVSVFQLKKAHSAYVSNEKVYSHEVFWVEGLGSAGNDGNFISYSQVVWYDQSGLQSIAISDMETPGITLVDVIQNNEFGRCFSVITNVSLLASESLIFAVSDKIIWSLQPTYEAFKAEMELCFYDSASMQSPLGTGIFRVFYDSGAVLRYEQLDAVNVNFR